MDSKIFVFLFAFFFFCARFSPAFPTTDRLRGFALRPHCVNTTSRWQDSNLWPSVPKTDALTRLRYTSSPPQNIWIYPIDKDSNRSAVAHPALGTGRREPPLLGKKPTILFHLHFLSLSFFLHLDLFFCLSNCICGYCCFASLSVPTNELSLTAPYGDHRIDSHFHVWRGSYTERLEILPGAGDSIKRDSEATISPLPSIGLARAFLV